MRNVITKVALAATFVMGVASSANAFVVLTMRDLSTATSVTCNTAAAVTATNCGAGFSITSANFVTYSGSVGAFDVVSTQGISNAPGNANLATANTTSLTVNRNDSAVGIKSLVVDFISFDFFNPNGTIKTFQGSASTTAGDGLFNSATESVFTDFRVDSDNAANSLGALSFNMGSGTVTDLNCTMATGTNNSCNAGNVLWNDPALGVAGFSTRTQQRFNLEASSVINTTSSLTIRNLPEPMTLSMVGAALLGLGIASRRRRAADKA